MPSPREPVGVVTCMLSFCAFHAPDVGRGSKLIAQLVLDGIARHAPHLQPAESWLWREAASRPPGRLPLDFPPHFCIDTNDVARSLAQHQAEAQLHVTVNGTAFPSSSGVVARSGSVVASDPVEGSEAETGGELNMF